MKKKLFALFMAFGLLLSAGISFAYEIKADAITKRIPMGTKLELEMATPVTTNGLSSGDMFSAYITKDVRVQGYVVLPQGTLIRGNAGKIKQPKRLSKSATLYLTFDHIVAPNGKQLPLSAGICQGFKLTQEGAIDGGGNYGSAIKENWSKSGEIIVKSTKWGVSSGEDLFKGGKYLVTPFSAIGGTIAGGAYFVGDSVFDLFRLGKDVCIAKGQKFTVLLMQPLDVPVL